MPFSFLDYINELDTNKKLHGRNQRSFVTNSSLKYHYIKTYNTKMIFSFPSVPTSFSLFFPSSPETHYMSCIPPGFREEPQSLHLKSSVPWGLCCFPTQEEAVTNWFQGKALKTSRWSRAEMQEKAFHDEDAQRLRKASRKCKS